MFGIGNGTQPLHASLASSLKQTLAHQEPPYPLKRNRLRTGINCFHSFSHMNKCVSTAGTTKELPLVLLQKPSTQSVLFPYSPAVSFKTSSGSHGNDYADFFSKAGASMNSVMVFRPLFSVIAKTHYTLDSTTNGDITFFSSNLSSSCSFFFRRNWFFQPFPCTVSSPAFAAAVLAFYYRYIYSSTHNQPWRTPSLAPVDLLFMISIISSFTCPVSAFLPKSSFSSHYLFLTFECDTIVGSARCFSALPWFGRI